MTPKLTHLLVYVIAVYIIFQILTRSDDSDILSHLPQSISHHLPHLPQNSPYQLPYQFPHLPNPLPNTNPEKSSTWRTILGVLVYPFYLLITILATPMPLLNTMLRIIVSIVTTVFYPITSTTRIMTRTFLLTPLNLVMNVVRALYPLWVFIGGTISIGCVLGVTAGWAGRVGLDWVLGRNRNRDRNPKKNKNNTTEANEQRPHDLKRTRSSRSSRSTRLSEPLKISVRDKRPTSPSSGDEPVPHTPGSSVHPILTEGGGGWQERGSKKGWGAGVEEGYRTGTGREGSVLGTRRRARGRMEED